MRVEPVALTPGRGCSLAVSRLEMVTAMKTLKKWNYAREAKFVDD
jgi:hypothetical protein